MFRPSRVIAALAVVASSTGAAVAADPAPRVAISDAPARTFELPIAPGALVASYQRVRARMLDAVDAVTDPGWMLDLADAIGTRFRDIRGGSRAWLIQIAAPLAPTPPDLTCLTAYPVPEHTTSGFGWRDDPIRHHNQFHAGADIHAARGTPVHAAGDGEIVFAGRQNGYGNIVYVDHGHGVITRYAHLSRILVKKGDAVMATQEIGLVGATGRATGPHLHFEVRIDGNPVAPALAMQVAELERTQPDVARLAALALAPDVQSHWINEQDPPRGSLAPKSARDKREHDKPAGDRPERRGRTPRVHLDS